MPSLSTYNSDLIPAGGRVIVYDNDTAAYELSPGASMPVDTVMGIGQGAGGYCSNSLTFIALDTFPRVGISDAVIIENGDGTNYYRLIAKSDGSLEFRWASATHEGVFTCAAGTIIQGLAAECATKTQMIAFILSNNGQSGQFYVGNLVDDDISEITTTAAIV